LDKNPQRARKIDGNNPFTVRLEAGLPLLLERAKKYVCFFIAIEMFVFLNGVTPTRGYPLLITLNGSAKNSFNIY